MVDRSLSSFINKFKHKKIEIPFPIETVQNQKRQAEDKLERFHADQHFGL